MTLADIVFLFVRGTLGIFIKIWNRHEVRGVEHIPLTGGCVLASNHLSYLDPPVLSCGTGRRKAWFLARNTLYGGNPWCFKATHCIPLDRERGEVGALRRCIHLLKDGHMLALFPEGTRSPDGTLQKAQSGVGFIVAKSGVPVVPALLEGTYEALPRQAKWVRPHKVRVTYGPPITPEEIAALGKGREAHDLIGRLIMDRIAALREDRREE